MKAKIIRSDVSRMEKGVRKQLGDIVNITKKELKSGGYAPLNINVARPNDTELSTEEDVPSHGDIEDGDGEG